ncbi:transient receptor potential cation channel subfamily a member 1-like [Gigaspora margarita]|uniref:Transient receptor potential cation channel subfamily a member 1-like n=1 Tax=Gigaspora margarita TaxID=4874 RepID=A0A8H4A2Z1_GIGMA|nr:transient receptor potential cation channel subfamily a member 1-like [Gigaspora margarita]
MEDTYIPIDDHDTHNGKQEEFITHDREQVTMITCSPNMKYIVTWSDMDKSAVFWRVSDNQQKLEPENKFSLKNNKQHKNYDKYFVYSKYIECQNNHSNIFGNIRNYLTVSDDKFVSMPISEEKDKIKVVIKDDVSEIKYVEMIKVGVFNFGTKKIVSLKLPHSEIIVETLAFLDGNNLDENKLIIISKEPLYRIYIFTREDDEFIHKSTIKVESYDEKIFLSNGKLFIYHEKLGSITKWDINTSKFEAYFLFDNSISVDNMKLSDNGVLLFVYGKKLDDKNPYQYISIYSADRGIRLTTCKYNKTVKVDAVYLIAPDIGARLLIVYHKSYRKNDDNYRCSICNPFAPFIPYKSYVKVNNENDLFKDFDVKFDNKFENNFENKFIIKYDKIVGFNNTGTLVIKDLIKDLIRDLIKDLIKDSEPNYNDLIFYLRNKLKDFNTYKKIYKKPHIFLTAKFKNDKTKSNTIQIVPEIYINSGKKVEEFVEECGCLDNDDLVMVTSLGVLIWTFNTKENKIELNYFWDDENNSLDWKSKEIINLFYDIDEENFGERKFDIKKLKKKKSYFFPTPSYIKDEETLLRKLFNGCIKQIEDDDETLNSQIFEIFSQSIFEIYKKNPSFFDNFFIKISLLCILKVISNFEPSKTDPQIFIMFPLPNFAAYDENEEDGFLKKLFKPKSSHFGKIDDSAFYNTWNGEALINFKWNTFGKKYYFVNWMIYIVFSGSFIIIATLLDNISWPCQKILLITTITLGFWHLQVEIRNLTFSYKEYFESLWNYIDLGAIISAIVTSIIWLINGSVSTGAITFTTLLLELKFIIYLRFIRCFGIYLAMIMNTADKVVAFLTLFGLIILAFAHSLHLLLRSEAFQDSGVNMFIQFGSSILAAYYMMVTGDSTPVSEWVSNENIIIMALMMIFSFFILTYLMNLFIGILGNLLGDNKDNHLAYLKLKKRNYKWFPYTFYYSVHIGEVYKLISYINSDDWEGSAKPIITKITKAIKDEKHESEFDKVKKMIDDVAKKRDQKQALEINKIKEMIDKIMKKLEIQSSEKHDN